MTSSRDVEADIRAGLAEDAKDYVDPFVGPPYLFTNTRHVRFVGQGPDNDFSIRETVHVTVNAEDEVTAEHISFEVDCG